MLRYYYYKNRKAILIAIPIFIIVIIVAIISLFFFKEEAKNDTKLLEEVLSQYEKVNKNLKSYSIKGYVLSGDTKTNILADINIQKEQKVKFEYTNNNNTVLYYLDDNFFYFKLYDIWYKNESNYVLPHEQVYLFEDLNAEKFIDETDKAYVLKINSTNPYDLFEILKLTGKYEGVTEDNMQMIKEEIVDNLNDWGYEAYINKETNYLEKLIFHTSINNANGINESITEYSFNNLNKDVKVTIPDRIVTYATSLNKLNQDIEDKKKQALSKTLK